MTVQPRKLDKLKKRLQHVLKQENLQTHRAIAQQLSDETAADTSLDLAAALIFISQPHLVQRSAAQETLLPPPSLVKPPIYRTVRYRLAVGSQHNVSDEQLIELLVQESGVDRKRIGRLIIRDTYTLVDLPDGMPADIFQLLSEAQIAGRQLNIKRVKPNRRKLRDNKRLNTNPQ